MKLNKITKKGFYTTDLKKREIIYEVLENTDENWVKDEPEDILLVDEWSYSHTDTDDIKHYKCDGCMYGVQNADNIEVEEITDTKYTIYGNSGALMCENKMTYKEKFNTLLKGDKETIRHLKILLPMIEFNKIAYDYLDKIIKDFEKDIEEQEQCGLGKLNLTN